MREADDTARNRPVVISMGHLLAGIAAFAGIAIGGIAGIWRQSLIPLEQDVRTLQQADQTMQSHIIRLEQDLRQHQHEDMHTGTRGELATLEEKVSDNRRRLDVIERQSIDVMRTLDELAQRIAGLEARSGSAPTLRQNPFPLMPGAPDK